MGITRKGRFITLEEFIIDTFTRIEDDGTEHPINRPDEIGGGGTYAIIGARMFLLPSTLGMIVDHTPSSLPTAMRNTLASYGPDMWYFRERKDGHSTTRAVNRYKGDLRHFEYLSKPPILTPMSFRDVHPEWLDPLPSVIHSITYPKRGLQILEEVKEMGRMYGDEGWRPLMVWEPEPHACRAEDLDVNSYITSQVDIVSPNHTEVLNLLSIPIPKTQPELSRAIEVALTRLLAFKPKQGAIIRSGALGACYAPTSNPQAIKWVPAYWKEGDGKVVDPTGCGNAFLGGVGAALYSGENLDTAVIWGSVAASFTIEQNGLPVMKVEDGKETWNGENPMDRVARLDRSRAV